jgi:hypothetical protein
MTCSTGSGLGDDGCVAESGVGGPGAWGVVESLAVAEFSEGVDGLDGLDGALGADSGAEAE